MNTKKENQTDRPNGMSSILSKLLSTECACGPVVLRIVLGVVMFPHGAQKLLGWYGGYGFSGTMGFFTDTMGLPWIIALGVILIEFFAPLMLLLGFGTRAAALGLGVVMTGALFMENIKYGFFMNWFGNQAGEGMEFSLLVIGISLSLLISGAGCFSIDKKIAGGINK